MEADFCVEALEEGLAKHGKPEIFNSPGEGRGQGSLPGPDPGIASEDFTRVLIDNKIAISMDGKGAWRDNVFPGSSPRTERLWKSVNYEEVYLRAYDSVGEAPSVAWPLSRFL